VRKKGGLRGKRIWIEGNLTWEERQVRWKIKEAIKEEKRNEARVWVGDNRTMIDGVW